MFYFHSHYGSTVGTATLLTLTCVFGGLDCFYRASAISILTRNIDIANLSVRPSVRNVPVSNGFTHGHSFFYHTVAQSF